jgi:hypothetical protein
MGEAELKRKKIIGQANNHALAPNPAQDFKHTM